MRNKDAEGYVMRLRNTIASLRIALNTSAELGAMRKEAYDTVLAEVDTQARRAFAAEQERDRLKGLLHAAGLSDGVRHCDTCERAWFAAIGCGGDACPFCALDDERQKREAAEAVLREAVAYWRTYVPEYVPVDDWVTRARAIVGWKEVET